MSEQQEIIALEIAVFDHSQKGWRIKTVSALRTNAPRFAIHRTHATDLNGDDRESYGWTVTHIPTGMAAMHYIDTPEAARIIACVVDALPLPFDRLTRDSYAEHYMRRKRLHWWLKAVKTLPTEIQGWLRNFPPALQVRQWPEWGMKP